MKRFRLRFLLGSLFLLTPFIPLSAQDPEGDAPILHNGLIREFILSDLNITLPVPDGTTPVLDNGKVRAVFGSGKTFSLDELVMNGRSLADKGSSPSPWLISCLGPNGEKFNFTPGHAWYTGARKVREGTVSKLIFSWHLLYDYSGKTYPVRVIVSLPDDADRLFWELEADQPEGWFITKTEFPKLSLRHPGKAKVITTSGWGVENPLTSAQIRSEYPTTTASMQFVMVYDAGGALFVGNEDPKGIRKDYYVDGNRTLNFSMTVPTSEGWTKDGVFRLPFATNMGFDPEGWEHALIHWYKPVTYTFPWGGEDRKIANRLGTLSPWLQESDGWIRVKGDEEEFAYTDAAADFFGPRLSIHWYWWQRHPYDTHYPDFIPAKAGFADKVAKVHAKGLHVTPYVNGRLWDPSSDSFKRDGGADACARGEDGNLYIEIYNGTSKVINAIACPSTRVWHDKLYGLVDSLQLLYGVDGVYIDQIGCSRQYPCWNPNHDHPRGGGEFWLESYRRILGDIRTGALRPGGILITEENGECYSDLFDLMLMVNTHYTAGVSRILPLFPMVYSDRVVTNAFKYFQEDVNVEKACDLRFRFAKALLYGSQPGWVRAFVIMNPKFRPEAEFLRNLMKFRSGIHDIVVGGSFVREFFPEGDNPVRKFDAFWDEHAVMGAEWLDRDGRRAWILVNTDSEPHKVRIPAYSKNRTLTVPADGAVVFRKK